MNLILFEPGETDHPLPRTDPRAGHILDVLRLQSGDSFDAGVVNGSKGKAALKKIESHQIHLDFNLFEDPPPPLPVGLLAGLPRPQTGRKILQEVTSLGISEIHFAPTEKGEPSYSDSRLWTTGEWKQRLIAGAEQAFTTRIPALSQHDSLEIAIDAITQRASVVALDNYEATAPLREFRPKHLPCVLAVGAERGWSATERDLFRRREIPLCGLGQNVLRTETACVCGLTLLLAGLELL